MRSADESTIIRIGIILIILYFILLRINPIIEILLLAFAFLLDGVDGYLAIREESKSQITVSMYMNYALGGRKYAKKIKAIKENIGKHVKYGPRFDVAADRITEYSFWTLFTVVGIVPFFVLLIVIIRHSITDAFIGAKGTSSKMKTSFAKIFYASNISRISINVLKFVTFSYLILVYVSHYPIIPGYILIFILVLFIVLRGAAEVNESLNNKE